MGEGTARVEGSRRGGLSEGGIWSTAYVPYAESLVRRDGCKGVALGWMPVYALHALSVVLEFQLSPLRRPEGGTNVRITTWLQVFLPGDRPGQCESLFHHACKARRSACK